MEHCWNDTERTKPKCLLAEKYTLVPQNTQTSHEISFVPLPIRMASPAIKKMYVNCGRKSGYNQERQTQFFLIFFITFCFFI